MYWPLKSKSSGKIKKKTIIPHKIAAVGTNAEKSRAFLFCQNLMLNFNGDLSFVIFLVINTAKAGVHINIAGKLKKA